MKLKWLAAGAIALITATLSYAAAPSISMGPNGLVYTPDALGNNIPNFSYAGYGGGGVTIPTLPVKKTISPVAGDNTSNIQSAINTVAAMAADSNGFRGAVLLNPGTYTCSGTLSISTGGVVLRGATPTSTIIQATGAARTFITVQGSGSASKTGSTVNITDSYVPCGARSFNVTSTS